MHIVIISDFGHVNGGAAKVAIDSAIALKEAGADVTFVYGVGPESDALGEAGLQPVHVPVEDVWTVRNPVAAARGAIWNEPGRRALESALSDRVGPRTLFHVHQWSKGFSPSVFAALRPFARPVLTTTHDYFPVCPNGAYFHFRKETPCALTPLSRACVTASCDRSSFAHKGVRVLRQQRLAGELARASDLTLVHVSALVRRVVEPLTPYPAVHEVVWNPSRLDRAASAAPWASRTFLFLGRITSEKGAGLFAEAARRAGVTARFVGDGPVKARLEEAYPEFDFAPWTEDVVGEMSAARALVLPSIWYETFGLVALEAMSLGVPAIVAEASGAADVITHDVNGLLTPNGDVDALAERLRALADSDALVRRLSQGAVELTPWDALTPQAHAKATLEVYERALARADTAAAAAAM